MDRLTSAADIGPVVRELRRRSGMTVHELAAKAGVSYGTVSFVENGRRVPHTPMLIAILDAVDADLSVSTRPADPVDNTSRQPNPTTPGFVPSDREREILYGYATGLSNRQITNVLGTSDHAVNNAAARMHKRMGAVDRAHAVAIAYQLGILTVGGEL